MSKLLARVRDRRARSDRRATVGALGELGGARGAGDEVVARPEEDGTRRVGLPTIEREWTTDLRRAENPTPLFAARRAIQREANSK